MKIILLIAQSVNNMASNNPNQLDLTSPVIHDAVRMVLLYEKAICAGNENLADDLLADSVPYMRKLTWEQNEWLRNVAGDLHMLEGKEILVPLEMSRQDYAFATNRAWLNIENDPEEMLRLSRIQQSTFTYDQVAYARSRAYNLLGFSDLAHEFLLHAMKLKPEAIEYKTLCLNGLYKREMFDEAWIVAQDIFRSPSASTEVIFITAGVIQQMLRGVNNDRARVIAGSIRLVLTRELNSARGMQAPQDLRAFGLVVLGMALQHLHRRSRALEAWTEAIQLDPNLEEAYLLRARLLHRRSESEAWPDYTKAVEMGTGDPLPYLVLAQKALRDGNGGGCIKLSQKALELGGSLIRAQAYELLGICEAETNGPTDLAMDYFTKASQLFPANENIKNNIRIFEEVRRESDREQVFARARTRWHSQEEGSDYRLVDLDIAPHWFEEAASGASQRLGLELAAA